VYLKGMAMGAADTVPGVSGGTIALVVGIYERLIAALTALDPRAVVHLERVHTREGRHALVASLVAMDVPFLAALGAGVVTAVVALSTVMHAAIVTVPALTYAFFGGLIAASAVVLYQHVEVDTPGRVGAAVAGVVLAFLVAGQAGGAEYVPTYPELFGAGAVAVVAMILPGVSGAFLLVLLNQYEYASELPGAFVAALVDAVRTGEFAGVVEAGTPVAVFVAGAVVGLLTVAHAVRWALSRSREATLAFLVSLMVGALRAPVREVADAVSVWTTSRALGVTVAAGVGLLAVLLLDHYTDDLEY
jgi:putative membrane protein